MRVVYQGLPAEVVPLVRPLVEEWQHLGPGWCAELFIHFSDADNDGDAASMNAQPEYRFAHIHLHPGWLKCDAEERRRLIVHELLHLALEPLLILAADILESADAGTPLENAWRRTYEGAVQDLTLSLTGP